jgi:predicted glutamine amidotransferase
MCEMLVATFDEPRPFTEVAPLASGLEQLGVAGYGWGVAWLDEAANGGAVRGVRGLGRYRDEGHRNYTLLTTVSRRFVVHLRRPSRLSTVQMADTQPFLDDGRSAWAHNGFLERAEELRGGYADRLHGRADSEVGWQFFLDRTAAGDQPLDALRAVDEAFGGRMNLAYLAVDGELSIYSRNETNRMWTFRLDGGVMAATDLHSADTSLFDLVVLRATDRELVEAGSAVRLAGPIASPSASRAGSTPDGSPGDDGAALPGGV